MSRIAVRAVQFNRLRGAQLDENGAKGKKDVARSRQKDKIIEINAKRKAAINEQEKADDERGLGKFIGSVVGAIVGVGVGGLAGWAAMGTAFALGFTGWGIVIAAGIGVVGLLGTLAGSWTGEQVGGLTAKANLDNKVKHERNAGLAEIERGKASDEFAKAQEGFEAANAKAQGVHQFNDELRRTNFQQGVYSNN